MIKSIKKIGEVLMNLNEYERITLINQFLLLQENGVENGHYDVKQYQNYIDILYNGYEGLYDEIFSSLPRNIISKDVSDEVGEILYMYDRAEISYSNLSKSEQMKIDVSDITFHGFDGNEEYDHYAICTFIIKNLKYYSSMFKTNELNSHFRTLGKYREQLKKFNEEKVSGDVLTLEGLIKVFSN